MLRHGGSFRRRQPLDGAALTRRKRVVNPSIMSPTDENESDKIRARIDRASAILRQRGYVVIEPAGLDPTQVLIVGPLVLDMVASTLSYGDATILLTPFKFLLAKALMEAEGTWCGRRALRKLLWGESASDDVNSLAVHVHQLRRQIAGLVGAEVVQASRLRGFRLAFDQLQTPSAEPERTS
jgi:DNA-binding response OmpR family regulator